MAIETLLKGASVSKRIQLTTTGIDALGNVVETPIPHASIIDVKVILSMRAKTIHMFSTNATDIAGDWEELTKETEEGEFTFGLTPAQTGALPVGVMVAETIRIYDTDGANETLVSSNKLYNVIDSEYSETL